MYFHCFHPYFEICRIHPRNTTEYTVFSRIHENTHRIHTEYTTCKNAEKCSSRNTRANQTRTSEIPAQNTYSAEYVFSDAYSCVFRAGSCVFRAYSPTCSCLPGTLSCRRWRFINLLLNLLGPTLLGRCLPSSAALALQPLQLWQPWLPWQPPSWQP